MATHHSILIAGGGSAGIAVAARLRMALPTVEVAVIEPSEHHFYQPLWTLVGGGVFDKEASRRPNSEYMPYGATWIKDKVASFEPDQNKVKLASGNELTYDFLVVALGIQLDWNKVDGLTEALGKDGVCSNYDYRFVDSTWKFLKDFKRGNAVFTMPPPPIKCAGAPQKIMYLADDHLRRQGVRNQSKVIYASGTAAIFGVKKYKDALEKVIESKQIETHFRRTFAPRIARQRTVSSSAAAIAQADANETPPSSFGVKHER